MPTAMPMTRLLPLALAVLVVLPAFAKGPPKPLPEWPCDTPFAGPLEPGMLWPGATARPENAWHADLAARHLVDFLTASENSPAMGEQEIADFAAKNGPVSSETAMLVVSGMVERGNLLRRVLLKGIKDQIIRSHVLADVVADDTAKLASAEKEGTPEALQRASAIKEARRQNLEALDDADDTAARLCHRLIYDEAKLRRLAAALKAHTQ
jgi:hypothetical protein